MSSFDSEAFAAAGQSHLLERLDQLSGAQAARFQRDLEQLDLPVLQRLWSIQEECEDQSAPEPPVLVELGDRAVRSDALSQGQALLAEGKVACLTVAGGQGSRLGWDGPKGTFPSGPITGDSLFEQFAGQNRARNQALRPSRALVHHDQPIESRINGGFLRAASPLWSGPKHGSFFHPRGDAFS